MTNTPEPVQTPKVKRGSWHEWAKTMRDQGHTYAQIAEAVGVTPTAVYFALRPEKRWRYQKKKGVEVISPTPYAPSAED